MTDASYVSFHDEEWGVHVHDDRYVNLTLMSCQFLLYFRVFVHVMVLTKFWYLMFLTICRKLFELLVLSGALAELTWPTILGKRDMFR